MRLPGRGDRAPAAPPRPAGAGTRHPPAHHRLRELAAAAGFRDADEIAVHLLVLYDGTLARWAREATVADLPGGDPLARARGLAAIVVAAVQPGRADVGPSGPSTTTVHNVSDSAGPM